MVSVRLREPDPPPLVDGSAAGREQGRFECVVSTGTQGFVVWLMGMALIAAMFYSFEVSARC
jgi:hypothetical protein